ncbi:hypothetical protein IQ07DRAFT_584500 [Pyrenochaeta sp. DS3sAY3a]|nr:hypothetical protein IQ07DRAFT_584500 [Pyrenochaeta sp. DS3sAY3a]
MYICCGNTRRRSKPLRAIITHSPPDSPLPIRTKPIPPHRNYQHGTSSLSYSLSSLRLPSNYHHTQYIPSPRYLPPPQPSPPR